MRAARERGESKTDWAFLPQNALDGENSGPGKGALLSLEFSARSVAAHRARATLPIDTHFARLNLCADKPTRTPTVSD
jgi:hypothetical protein